MTEPRTQTEAVERRIVDALTTIRREWEHMLPTTAPAQRIGGGSRSAQITAADDDDADHDVDAATRLVSFRRHATDELVQWCRLVIEDRPVTATPVDGSDVPAMCAFLETHAQWLSGHRDADEAADRLGGCTPDCEARQLVPTHSCAGLARQVRRYAPPPIVDQPRPPKPRLIGTCPTEWETTDEDGQLILKPCGGRVLAYPTGLLDPTIAEQRAAPLPTCDHCGQAATVDWWYAEMYDDYGLSHLVTVDELITVIAVRLDYIATRSQIRQWKHRGRIEGAGVDSKGRTLYRHDDVVAAIEDDPIITRGRAAS